MIHTMYTTAWCVIKIRAIFCKVSCKRSGYLGFTPHSATVTTRIITFLVGNFIYHCYGVQVDPKDILDISSSIMSPSLQLRWKWQSPSLQLTVPSTGYEPKKRWNKLGGKLRSPNFASWGLTASRKDSLTPPKTNMESENQSVEKEIHLPNLHYWVPC